MEPFEERVLRQIKKQQLLIAGDRLLIACSGGVDSMALLHFFDAAKDYLQIELAVVHVDHMLRGNVSAQDRAFVETFCMKRDIKVYSTAISIPTILEDEGGNTQAICRRERYRFFDEVMKEGHFTKLATAHHADDQLETMLMGITKASTINGILGMRACRNFSRGMLIRPFLQVTKLEIGQYLEHKGGSYREDVSNTKDSYTRNRFRHHMIPLLVEENKHVALHASQLSMQLQQDNDYLMELAQQAFHRIVNKKGENLYSVEICAYQKEPLALQRRLILILLNYIYNDLSTLHSQSLISSIFTLFETKNGTATIHLPAQFIARREYGVVTFGPAQQALVEAPYTLVLNKWNKYANVDVFVGPCCEPLDGDCYYFNASKVKFPLYVRTRKQGDRIKLAGMEHDKRLSRLFIDDKIPLVKRDIWPLLVNEEDDILAVLGVRVNNKFSKQRRADDDYVLITRLTE
ncbi:tRNA lysidine(34) synthetase TilS [Solibacillus sp. CAU 1738]|uniref:tRNA lysidine(34) synthetase TilS n=1 Tax=Solibacillus sp. CAU 1738 TaxID=3140363 RepID=UPI003260CB68